MTDVLLPRGNARDTACMNDYERAFRSTIEDVWRAAIPAHIVDAWFTRGDVERALFTATPAQLPWLASFDRDAARAAETTERALRSASTVNDLARVLAIAPISAVHEPRVVRLIRELDPMRMRPWLRALLSLRLRNDEGTALAARIASGDDVPELAVDVGDPGALLRLHAAAIVTDDAQRAALVASALERADGGGWTGPPPEGSDMLLPAIASAHSWSALAQRELGSDVRAPAALLAMRTGDVDAALSVANDDPVSVARACFATDAVPPSWKRVVALKDEAGIEEWYADGLITDGERAQMLAARAWCEGAAAFERVIVDAVVAAHHACVHVAARIDALSEGAPAAIVDVDARMRSIARLIESEAKKPRRGLGYWRAHFIVAELGIAGAHDEAERAFRDIEEAACNAGVDREPSPSAIAALRGRAKEARDALGTHSTPLETAPVALALAREGFHDDARALLARILKDGVGAVNDVVTATLRITDPSIATAVAAVTAANAADKPGANDDDARQWLATPVKRRKLRIVEREPVAVGANDDVGDEAL